MDIKAASAAVLKNTAAVTSLLGGGAASVLPAGRLQQGESDATQFPAVTIQSGELAGSVSRFPFYNETLFVRVYDQPEGPSTLTFVRINQIVEEVVAALHLAQLSSSQSYRATFELRFDDYISPESWDDFLKLPFRLVRFRAYGVSLLPYNP